MFLLPTAICTIIILLIAYKIDKDCFIPMTAIFCAISIIGSSAIYGISIFSKTCAQEVWSGTIVAVSHQEEYDEVVTETHTDSKGNTYTTTHIEHHEAENHVKTSDGGNIFVRESLDRKTRFNDSYPNTDAELEKFYPIGTPSSSTHTYTNKVQASYSIYKHKEIDLKKYKEIDLKKYKGLPEYPSNLKNAIQIDRFIGDIKNKDAINDKLASINSELNSKQNNKQVNLIFVNLGSKPEDYGFALQDYWLGGNKNDFIVCYGSEGDKITWVYPFSWADSEKSERLKIDVRNYMLKVNLAEDFSLHIDKIGDMIKQNFERKQFADFNYLKIELSVWGYVLIVIFNILLAIVVLTKGEMLGVLFDS